MSPLNAPKTAHLMPGEAVPDICHRRDAEAAAGLAELAYELLDAHTDTAQLVDGFPYDPSWAAHLDYLRALQRKGREMLARTVLEELSPCCWDDVGSLDVR